MIDKLDTIKIINFSSTTRMNMIIGRQATDLEKIFVKVQGRVGGRKGKGGNDVILISKTKKLFKK